MNADFYIFICEKLGSLPLVCWCPSPTPPGAKPPGYEVESPLRGLRGPEGLAFRSSDVPRPGRSERPTRYRETTKICVPKILADGANLAGQFYNAPQKLWWIYEANCL